MNELSFKETRKLLDSIQKTRLVPCLIGHTGIGKTELVKQFCNDKGWDLITLHVAQLEPADFMGLPKATKEGTTQFCRPDWLPTEEASNSKGTVIFLDEVNRGHEDIRQALYQLLTDKRLHNYKVPNNCYIIAAANPSNDYEVYEFDKALINRFAWIKIKPTPSETCKYLGSKYGSNALLSWVNSDRSVLDVGESFNIDNMKFSGRSLENAIMLYNEIKGESRAFIRKSLMTIIPSEKAAAFMSYLEESETLSYKDILEGNKAEHLDKMIADNRMDVLSNLVSGLAQYYNSIDKVKKAELSRVLAFFNKLPSLEHLVTFNNNLENFKQHILYNNEEYKEFFIDKTKHIQLDNLNKQSQGG